MPPFETTFQSSATRLDGRATPIPFCQWIGGRTWGAGWDLPAGEADAGGQAYRCSKRAVKPEPYELPQSRLKTDWTAFFASRRTHALCADLYTDSPSPFAAASKLKQSYSDACGDRLSISAPAIRPTLHNPKIGPPP